MWFCFGFYNSNLIMQTLKDACQNSYYIHEIQISYVSASFIYSILLLLFFDGWNWFILLMLHVSLFLNISILILMHLYMYKSKYYFMEMFISVLIISLLLIMSAILLYPFYMCVYIKNLVEFLIKSHQMELNYEVVKLKIFALLSSIHFWLFL